MMDNSYYRDNDSTDRQTPLNSTANNDNLRMRLGLELSGPQGNGESITHAARVDINAIMLFVYTGAYGGLSSHLTTGSSGTLSASYPSE